MNRTLLPLALMYAGDGEPIEGRTRLQKMVFLMQQRFQEDGEEFIYSDGYDFVPYDYGPFAAGLYDDLDDLEGDLVESREEPIREGKTKYIYEITEDGQEFIKQHLSDGEVRRILALAADIKKEYNDVWLSELIEDVYSRYPEFAENSIY